MQWDLDKLIFWIQLNKDRNYISHELKTIWMSSFIIFQFFFFFALVHIHNQEKYERVIYFAYFAFSFTLLSVLYLSSVFLLFLLLPCCNKKVDNWFLKTINVPQINNAQKLDLISSLTILSRRPIHLAEVGGADKQFHKIWPKPIANVKQSQGASL